MTIVGSTGTVVHRYLVAGEDLVLACELSRPDAIVRWLRNGQEVHPGERVQVEARGVLRQLTINGAQPSDAGCYVCDAASDRMVTNVEVLGELAQNPRDPQNGGIMPQTRTRGGEASVTLLMAEARVAAGKGGSLVRNPRGAVGQKGTCQGRGETCPCCLPQPGSV